MTLKSPFYTPNCSEPKVLFSLLIVISQYLKLGGTFLGEQKSI